MAGKKQEQPQTVARNRRAHHDYEILDQIECGIMLTGSEVKSIRNGKISLDEAYAHVRDGELFLVNSDIAHDPQATVMNHEPRRTRKLLMHKRELNKYIEAADHKGLTLIPLAVYFARGRAKVKLAIAQGRKL